MEGPRVGGVRLVDWCTRGPTRRALKTRSRSGLDSWSPKNEELFRIAPVDRPRVGGVRLVDRAHMEPYKRGVVPDWTRGTTFGALKTRSCSELDEWIVLAWSPQNKEVFRI